MNSNWSYSPETPNLGQIRRFFSRDLAIWRMTLKNNRAPLQCHFKLCASFRSHRWIQTWVTVRKHPIWVKFDDFLSSIKLYASFHHHMWIQIWVTVRKRLSWVVTSVTLTFDLWPLTFCMDLTLVIGNNSRKFHDDTWWEHSQKGVTNGQTDRRKIPIVELLGRS